MYFNEKQTISVYDYHDTTDQGGLSETNHEISEIINASYATSNASPSPCWPNYQTSSENQNNFQANPNENNERYENHIEIINQDRYDMVCDDESFEEKINLTENYGASHSATSNDGNGNKVTPMNNEKRCKVINELIATERDYLENLQIVKECFIYPMKQGNILIEDEMEIIFINWNDLALCTNRLYKSLKIRRKMTTKKDINIGDILCENVSMK